MTSGVVTDRAFRYPVPFKCEFKPRSGFTAQLIQTSMTDFE